MLQSFFRRPAQITAFVAAILLSLLGSSSTFAATRNGNTPLAPHIICQSDYEPHSGWVVTQVFTPFFGCAFNLYNKEYQIAPPPTAQITLCDVSPIPPNFLLTAQYLAPGQCGAPWGKSLTLLPTTEISTHPFLTICASSSIPQNWVTIAETRTNTAASICFDDGLLAKFDSTHPIQKTVQPPPLGIFPLLICADSLIPIGFTHLTDVNSTACPLDHAKSPVIIRTN